MQIDGNLIEPGLAFLEGLALVASPCILPVLPLVLSTSVGGGRGRPFGIIGGFVVSFSLFALLSRWVVSALGIDLDIIKYASLVLLGMLGLVMLVPVLSNRFGAWTQGLADWGNRKTANTGGGFGSGLAIGGLIGLIWTPCAGPILAAVLVQVIRQQSDVRGLAILLAFGLGAGVPMLLISLIGRSFMGRLGYLKTHAEAIKRGFGALILLAVIFIASGIDPESLFTQNKPSTEATMTLAGEPGVTAGAHELVEPLASPYPAPEFTGIKGWLNSAPLTMASLKGKVVLIDFWTYSCINCVRTLPTITAWDAKYRDDGLVIIGVHAPEFEFEKKEDNVRAAIAQHGILYPVALDSDLATWGAFKNQYWPAHYLINREGQVVYTHFGEGHYAETEHNIRVLLGLSGAKTMAATVPAFDKEQTPETYLGVAKAARYGGDTKLARGGAAYRYPVQLAANTWALQGPWNIGLEKITSMGAGSSLRLNFFSKKVFLVLGTATGKPVKAAIKLGNTGAGASAGKDVTDNTVTVTRNSLYELINQDSLKAGTFELVALDPGLEAYAFTFGR
jgi:cytochrome c biogenesis protein CcdA/thiol-disulfide isomerase/thioredoxin